jgi:hypothetical protein
MKRFAIICLGTLLGSCNATTKDGAPVILDGSMMGMVREINDPGSTYRSRQAADDRKCREYGFKPGTEAYGNCRLQLDQIRATEEAAYITARPR